MLPKTTLFVAAVVFGIVAPQVGRAVDEAVIRIEDEQVMLRHLLPQVKGKLGRLVLAHAPPLGQTLTLRKRTVLRRLQRAKLDDHLARLDSEHWPEKWQVQRAAQTIDAFELSEMLRQRLIQQIGERGTVERVDVAQGLVLPKGDVELDVRLPRYVRSGRRRVSASVLLHGRRIRHLNAEVELEMKERGDRVIRRGAMVELVAEGPGIFVRNRAIAQESGRVGDVIAVLSQGSKRLVHGRIRDAHTVEVDL